MIDNNVVKGQSRWRFTFHHLLFTSCLFLLSACTPAQTNSVSFAFAGDAAELAAYQTLIDAFELAHPEISIEVRHAPSRPEFEQKLITMFDAGAPPDVVLLNYRRVARFAADGELHPIEIGDVSADGGAPFYPIALEAFTIDGELWCVPQNISSLVVYVNQELLAQARLDMPHPDWGWPDLVETAKAISTLSSEVDGVGIEPNLYRLAPIVWQANGTLFSESAGLLPPIPQNEGAVRWLAELQTVHGIAPSQLEAESLSIEDRFLAGRLGMIFESRRFTPILRRSAQFDWDVVPLPRGAQTAGVLHSDGYCLGTEPRAETLEFIRFATSVVGQEIMAQTGRTVPSRMSVAESELFLEPGLPPASSYIWVDEVEQLNLVPHHPNWIEMEKLASAEIERAFYEHISPNVMIEMINTKIETIDTGGP